MRNPIQVLDCAIYTPSDPDNPLPAYWTVAVPIPEGPEICDDPAAGYLEVAALRSPNHAISKAAHLLHQLGFHGHVYVNDHTWRDNFALINCSPEKPTVRFNPRITLALAWQEHCYAHPKEGG